MTERDLKRLALELTGGKSPWDVSLVEVCRSARTVLRVSAASVLLISGPARGLAAGSDPVVEGLDKLQAILGEGPTFEAARDARPVLVGDIILYKARWPQFVVRAVEQRVAAIFSFPLRLGLVPLGVLTLYRGSRGPLSVTQRRLAMQVADAIVEIVLAAEAYERPY